MVEEISSRLYRAGKAALSSRKRFLSSLFFSTLVFLLLAFSTDIPWHMQTIQMGLEYWDEALLNSIIGVYLGGLNSLILTLSYSILSGVVLTNFGLQLFNKNFAGRELGGILPGFVATGCASCGIGFTTFLGLTGASIAPFGGDMFKLVGALLLIYAMYNLGDPEICSIPSS